MRNPELETFEKEKTLKLDEQRKKRRSGSDRALRMAVAARGDRLVSSMAVGHGAVVARVLEKESSVQLGHLRKG